jgi:nicotinate-nucleotide pyrophosphorylase
VTAAIARAREVGEANEAIAAGADVIMLDNIEGGELRSVARRLRDRWAGEGKKFLLETSGVSPKAACTNVQSAVGGSPSAQNIHRHHKQRSIS